MSKRTALIILFLILVAATLLRSYQLTSRSLWFDEAFSWRLIQFPLGEMIARAAADVHPPLYYIALKGWSIVFGTSLASLRSFSVTAATLTVGAAYLFGATAARSRGAGLLAATFLAISGWQIQFAWEARMYTIGCLLALLSSWALLCAMRSEPQSPRWWALYALLAAAFAYIHYYAFFTIAAQLLFVVGFLIVTTRGRLGELLQARRFWYAVLAVLCAVAMYLPWLPTFWQQNSRVQDSYWISAIGGWSIPDTFYRMFIPTATIPRHEGGVWILSALVPIAATLLFWAMLVRRGSRDKSIDDARWFVLLLGVVPFLLSIIVSLISQSLYQDRFFVFAHLFILMALALLLSRIPWRAVKTTAIAVVILGLVGTSLRFWQEIDIKNKPGAHAAALYIFAHKHMDEPILVSSPFIYFTIAHYAQEEFDNSTTPLLYSESGQLAHFAGGPILTPADVVGPALFTTPSNTLWMVDTTGFGATPLIPPAPWHATESKSFPEVYFYQGHVQVTKYEKSP